MEEVSSARQGTAGLVESTKGVQGLGTGEGETRFPTPSSTKATREPATPHTSVPGTIDEWQDASWDALEHIKIPKAPRLRIGVRGRVRGWGGGKWRRGKAVPGEDAARESAERRAARTRRDAINSRRQIEPWSNATPPIGLTV